MSYNGKIDPEKFGPSDDESNLVRALTSHRTELPRKQVVEQIGRALKSVPLTDDEAIELYEVIKARLKFVTCSRCQKLTPKVEAEIIDNRRVCESCQV